MCGRFTLTTRDRAQIADSLHAELDRGVERLGRPRFNAAPGQDHLVVVGPSERPRICMGHWGFPGRRDRLLINARSETVATLASFRRAYAQHRCFVVADGFFEWSRGAAASPYWFHKHNKDLLLLAGIYQPRPATDELAFAILTAQADGPVAEIHQRMPVMLDPEADGGHELLYAWLSNATTASLPVNISGMNLQRDPVSHKVSNPAYDHADCITPVVRPVQRSLFPED